MHPFSFHIIQWYHKNKRDLPWRDTQDPYIIWLSEIILQQTRVDQGMPYFYKFVEKFPSVKDFALATEDEILTLWQGLGYYSRARNMHQAAQMVLRDFDGKFPVDYHDLLRLKGIGEYTAAAIASFAGGQPKAVVDGNVFRVLSRYFNVDTPINTGRGKKEFQFLADEVLDSSQPGIFNQAIMEFGALQCKPRNPLCDTCVLRTECLAYAAGTVDQLPIKQKARPARKRYFHYFLVQDTDRILMHKRGEGDIWTNMYQLPLIETFIPAGSDQIPEPSSSVLLKQFEEVFGTQVPLTLLEGPVLHLLSHQQIHAYFWAIEGASLDKVATKQNWNYVNTKDLNTLAKPKLIFSFLERTIIN